MARGGCRLGRWAEGGLGSETSRDARGTREVDGTAGSEPVRDPDAKRSPPHRHPLGQDGTGHAPAQNPAHSTNSRGRCLLLRSGCLESS